MIFFPDAGTLDNDNVGKVQYPGSFTGCLLSGEVKRVQCVSYTVILSLVFSGLDDSKKIVWPAKSDAFDE